MNDYLKILRFEKSSGNQLSDELNSVRFYLTYTVRYGMYGYECQMTVLQFHGLISRQSITKTFNWDVQGFTLFSYFCSIT